MLPIVPGPAMVTRLRLRPVKSLLRQLLPPPDPSPESPRLPPPAEAMSPATGVRRLQRGESVGLLHMILRLTTAKRLMAQVLGPSQAT